ncbi:MAG: hypothetical protein IJE07_01415 [Clostridia bacterium]|nr:hypothetical protein [Clostridia bacterium]
MIGTCFRSIATGNGLTVSAGLAYGMLNGCFVTLSEDTGARRISIYVGPQEQPAPGYTQSQTVSCAQQICHTISTASGPDNVYALLTGGEALPALVLNHAGSVVTVNFQAAPEADAGVTRFITELLPQVAALTRPGHCILCCTDASGAAVPVRLSADTVVPMHAACHRKVLGYTAPSPEERAAQTRATLAAALGGLIGAALWLLSAFGPIAWGLAVLMGLLPTIGYDLLKGKAGRSRWVTIVICAVCAVLLGSFGAAFITAHGEWMHDITVNQANGIGYLAFAWASVLNPVTAATLTLRKSLIAGFILGAVGCIGCFRRTAESTDTAATAERPRRLRGKF